VSGEAAPVEQARYRRLTPAWRALLIALVTGAIGLALNQLLNLGFFVGKTLIDSAYLYWLAALLVGGAFLLLPAGKRARRGGSANGGAARRPSLLVVPASLLGNWRDEAERFAPSLKFAYAHRSQAIADEIERLGIRPSGDWSVETT